MSQTTREVAVAVLALVQAFFMCGSFYGWPALVLALRRERLFDYCAGQADCPAQDMHFSSVFVTACMVGGIFQLPVGMLLDSRGPRFANLLGCVGFISGTILIALSNDGFDALYPGLIILAISSSLVLFSLFHVANLFPKSPGMYLALLNGTYDSSMLGWSFLELLNRLWGFRHLYLMLVVACIGFLLLLLAWFVWPEQPYTLHPYECLEDGEACGEMETQPYARLAALPLSDQVRRREFWMVLAFVALGMFRMKFYFATVEPYERVLFGKTLGSQLTDTFSFILPFGAFASPLVGAANDRVGVLFGPTLAIVLSCVWEVLCTQRVVWAQYVTFVVFGIGRVFFYASAVTMCVVLFGPNSIGRAFGSAMTAGGLLVGLQYVLIREAYRSYGGDQTVNHHYLIVCGALSLLLLVSLKLRQDYWKSHSMSVTPVN